MTQTLKVETYSNPQHLSEPDGDPPPGCTWEAGERDVEIENGRVKAVVVWEAVKSDDAQTGLKRRARRAEAFLNDVAEAAGLAKGEWVPAGLAPMIREKIDEFEEMVEKRDDRISELEDAWSGLQQDVNRKQERLHDVTWELQDLLDDVFDVDATDATLDEALRELGDQVEGMRGEAQDARARAHASEDCLESIRSHYQDRMDTLCDLLEETFGVQCPEGLPPEGIVERVVRNTLELQEERDALAERIDEIDDEKMGVSHENQSLKTVLDNILAECAPYLDDEGWRFDEAGAAVEQAIQNLEGQRDTAIEALTGPPEGGEAEDEPEDNAEAPEDQSVEACIDDVPVDRYTWQPASELAEKLDTTPQIIGMTAARYDEGQDTKWPLEMRQTTSGKEYRIEPGESPLSEHFVYLIGPEVPEGVAVEEVFEDETEAKKEAAAYKTEKDPDDYKPPVVRVERARTDVPEMHETLTWDAIEGNEGMEVVQ